MQESLTTLADLLTRPEFVLGLLVGAVALVIDLGLSRVGTGRLADWGTLLTIAVVVGIHVHIGRRISLVIAIAVLAAGGWAVDVARRRDGSRLLALAGWAVMAIGAFLFSTRSGLPQIDWVRVVAPLVAIGGGLALRTWDHIDRRRYVGSLFAITAFGIWATVPATASARILLGVSIPMALGTTALARGRISGAGAISATAVAVWVVALGGEPRPASMIGGWACLGLLVALPIVVRYRALARGPGLLLGGHGLVVLVASRVIGLQESMTVALLGVTGLAVVVAVAGLLVSEPLGRGAPGADSA